MKTKQLAICEIALKIAAEEKYKDEIIYPEMAEMEELNHKDWVENAIEIWIEEARKEMTMDSYCVRFVNEFSVQGRDRSEAIKKAQELVEAIPISDFDIQVELMEKGGEDDKEREGR